MRGSECKNSVEERQEREQEIRKELRKFLFHCFERTFLYGSLSKEYGDVKMYKREEEFYERALYNIHLHQSH